MDDGQTGDGGGREKSPQDGDIACGKLLWPHLGWIPQMVVKRLRESTFKMILIHSRWGIIFGNWPRDLFFFIPQGMGWFYHRWCMEIRGSDGLGGSCFMFPTLGRLVCSCKLDVFYYGWNRMCFFIYFDEWLFCAASSKWPFVEFIVALLSDLKLLPFGCSKGHLAIWFTRDFGFCWMIHSLNGLRNFGFFRRIWVSWRATGMYRYLLGRSRANWWWSCLRV